MRRAYSTDFRARVLAVHRSGSTCRVTAVRFGVAVSSVVKWSLLEARTGGGDQRASQTHLGCYYDWLMARVQDCFEVTLFILRGARGTGVA